MSDRYLLPRAVRLTVRRRDQHHRVTGFAALSASVMRAGTGFDCDQANGLGAEKGQCLILPQLLAERRHVGGIRRVGLDTFLVISRPMGQTSVTGAALWWFSTSPSWHVDADGWRRPHHWKAITVRAGLCASRLKARWGIRGVSRGGGDGMMALRSNPQDTP